MMSGYTEQEMKRRFEGKEPAGFLQKPYRINDLLSVLDRVIQGEEVSS